MLDIPYKSLVKRAIATYTLLPSMNFLNLSKSN
jgi:hypothetical protein